MIVNNDGGVAAVRPICICPAQHKISWTCRQSKPTIYYHADADCCFRQNLSKLGNDF